jgi:hypothetical protein
MEALMIHNRTNDALVERGRSWTREGIEIRNYADGSNRITARVSSDGVLLARRLGVVCPGLEVTFVELAQLAVFLRWWEAHRTGWAAFYWSGAGFPPGYGAQAIYQPPGSKPRTIVARRVLGKLEGEDFIGRDELEEVDRPVRVAGTIDQVSRVIRHGERVGNPAGEESGGLYACGSLSFEADRIGTSVRRGKQWILFEPADSIFLERLLDQSRRKRRRTIR